MIEEDRNPILNICEFFGIGMLVMFVAIIIFAVHTETKEENFKKTHTCVKTKWVEQTCTNATNKSRIRTYDCSYEVCVEYEKIEKVEK